MKKLIEPSLPRMNGVTAALLMNEAALAKPGPIGEMIVGHVLATASRAAVEVTQDLINAYKSCWALIAEEKDRQPRHYPSVKKSEEHSMDAYVRGFKSRMPDYGDADRIIEGGYNWPDSLPYSDHFLLPPEIVEAIFWTQGYETARETLAYFEHVKRTEKK